jgi:hypothetical protein
MSVLSDEVRLMNRLCAFALSLAATLLLAAPPALAQNQPAAAGSGTTHEGVVVSSTRSTLVVRTTQGTYELFVLDRNTTRPSQIPLQSTVSVTGTRSAPDQPYTALSVRVTGEPPPKGAEPAPGATEAVPQSVRNMESTIQRQARRFKLGVRTGMALDPELVLVGGQVQLGPFFRSDVFFRPSLEFGFGEVTTLVSFNADVIYRLPVSAQGDKWSMFIGGGPGFDFSKLGFTSEGEEDNDDFSFDDLEFDGGLNIVIGLQSRNGMFLELRSTAYSKPHLRFVVGFNF